MSKKTEYLGSAGIRRRGRSECVASNTNAANSQTVLNAKSIEREQ